VGAASAATELQAKVAKNRGSGFSRDTSHGRIAWHHFFPQWLAALRFICGKKDPTLSALRPTTLALFDGATSMVMGPANGMSLRAK